MKNIHEKYCKDCGKIIHVKAEICPYCGCRQTWFPSCLCEKNKIVAGLLALFLGGFGIHKFYLGRVGLGIVYLLFCWTGIPTIIAFIEGILYFCMSEEKFIKKYGV